ncbi:MAG TPA: hypothetical protein VLJ39_05235 [Tepidisphaeraceae bacterium]|nr:hypothetical protein [Tepidisphaeraceae bacterium]
MVRLSPPTARGAVCKTIFFAELEDGPALSLVEYDDGKLDILRGGSPIPDGPWPVSNLPDCIDTFQRIAHQSAPLLRKN